MTIKEKLDVARQLAKLGVDVIEAGFPVSSEADLEAVKLIAKEVGSDVYEDGYVPVICGLARCNKRDIDKAWEAVKYIHMKFKLKMIRDEVVEKARSMVSYARSIGCYDVEFSPEDAGRSDLEFLYHILGEAIKAGATTINIPDTVGYTVPEEFGRLIANIKSNTPGIEDVILSTHCQNDLGLSTANTLAGACAGARQVEVIINGIGERAGNASLEEVVMALKCGGEQVLRGLYTGINTQHILMSSKMVEEYTGLHVQPHKAIVGANAFAHQSGIHQFLQAKMLELGYEIEGKELGDLFWQFKSVAEKKKKITDDDLIALMSDEVFQPQFVWQLQNATCGSLDLSTATVKLIDAAGQEHISCSVGTGPVDAAYKAVDLIVKVPVTLLEYSMNAVTHGRRHSFNQSLNSWREWSCINPCFNWRDLEQEQIWILFSCVRAYIGALNKMMSFKKLLAKSNKPEGNAVI
ncbi:unnamed protein product [Withania somnifera]